MIRETPGRRISVRGTDLHIEESGSGATSVVFESGAGAGRTLWDPVVALLGDVARTVTYDRAGRGRSARPERPQSIEDMAITLVALVETLAPRRVVLVGHSMGGLIIRRAAEKLSPPPAGLILVDPTPEAAPIYDDWTKTATKTDRILAVQQRLALCPPLMRVLTRSHGRLFPTDTYATMLAEDFTPAGIARTRYEIAAVATAIDEFRGHPPQLPNSPVTVLSANRAARHQARNLDVIREYHRHYAEQIGARLEECDSEHIVPAEQPAQVAAAIRRLVNTAADSFGKLPVRD
ncbi:alpha/beta hydrolase [Nocardia aurea]|uniref:Alpha/beta hydrolase n=1 Tax=Nocardia aurea TaxID=2144174 RepID=A0ABV3FY24_9NOCA